MIKAHKPGLYLFFVGEECGGIGSSAYVKDNPSFSANMVVSFDRRGTKDIITHQGGYETCSSKFAKGLAHALNLQNVDFEYKPCDGGVYTDSREFAEIVPECTNIAVGYYNEHTAKEFQDLHHLLALRDAVLAVDWHKLPIDRVPEPDVPWQSFYDNRDLPGMPVLDPPKGKYGFNTRAEAKAAVKAIEDAAWNEELDTLTLYTNLSIIKGYLL